MPLSAPRITLVRTYPYLASSPSQEELPDATLYIDQPPVTAKGPSAGALVDLHQEKIKELSGTTLDPDKKQNDMIKEAKDKRDAMYLNAQRPAYEPSSRRMPKQGWNGTTQVSKNNSRMFDGMQARPYTFQLCGTPTARAKSGPRSIASWQRDYNTKGLCDEKCQPLRFQRVLKMKQEATKEAQRRNVPVEVVEEEMYQALRARSHRIDTNLRKCEFHAPTRAVPVNGGPPKIFDGSEKLEENFSFKDARDMFRGDAWEAMAESLEKVNEFKPPGRGLEDNKTGKRGSFSAGVSPAELAKAQHALHQSAAKQRKDDAVREDLEKLKLLLVRKYGTISACWRHLLDPGHVGKLSFVEWSRALRAVGFQGNIKAAYKILDDDDSGIVTFNEFAPDMATKVRDFRQKIVRTWGEDWTEVWKQIDENGNNQLDKDEFSSVCFQIGYSYDHFELFKEIRELPSRRFLNLDDFKAIPIV